MFTDDRSDRHAWDVLRHALGRAGSEHVVWTQLEVEILITQEPVHESEELNNQLVLPHVVAVLEDDGKRRSV